MRRYLALPLLLVALSIAACGDDSSNETAATPTEAATETATEAAKEPSSGDSGVKVSGKVGEKPKIEVSGGDPPSELVIDDVKKGKGPKAKAGQNVSVNYSGVLFKDGSEFDNSFDRGEPFSFQLGGGMVIRGWDQGLEGMQVGGRRVLTIPPDLAYGARGSGPIGPNETLVFVVDMENITSP